MRRPNKYDRGKSWTRRGYSGNARRPDTRTQFLPAIAAKPLRSRLRQTTEMSEPSGFNLSSLIGSAREKLPALADRILEITLGLDPIELLSHLTLLHQTYQEGVSPETEEIANWQVKIEWLCSLLLARGLPDHRTLHMVGDSILSPLDAALEEYFATSGLVAAAGGRQRD